MLQKELAKRLKARYDTKMDGNGWLEVSSDGIPLCRIKYNGQFLSNADQNLSCEYRSKIADIQDEISTVREYVGLYEHAPQMKAADVSEYRQLAAFGDARTATATKRRACTTTSMMQPSGSSIRTATGTSTASATRRSMPQLVRIPMATAMSAELIRHTRCISAASPRILSGRFPMRTSKKQTPITRKTAVPGFL